MFLAPARARGNCTAHRNRTNLPNVYFCREIEIIRRNQTARSRNRALKTSLGALALAAGITACGPPAPPVNHIVMAPTVVPNLFTPIDHSEGFTHHFPRNPATDSWLTDDLVHDPSYLYGLYELAQYDFPDIPGACAAAQLKTVRIELAVDFDGAITNFTLPAGQNVYDGISFSPDFPTSVVREVPVKTISGALNYWRTTTSAGTFNGTSSAAAVDTNIDVTYDATGATAGEFSDFYVMFNHSVNQLPNLGFGGSSVTTTPPRVTVTYDNTACL